MVRSAVEKMRQGEGRGTAHGTSLKCSAHDILSLASLPPAQLSQNLF